MKQIVRVAQPPAPGTSTETVAVAEQELLSRCRTTLTKDEWGYLDQVVRRFHRHEVAAGECASMVVQRIRAPIAVVWDTVRRFDEPQRYKHFVKRCEIRNHAGVDDAPASAALGVGSVRDVWVVSGLPAVCSTERLEVLDDENHVIGFRVLGGQHRLRSYRSVTSLHQIAAAEEDDEERPPITFVVESYVVGVPDGNSPDDTLTFVDTVVRCNLQSLARVSERWHRQTCSATSAS